MNQFDLYSMNVNNFNLSNDDVDEYINTLRSFNEFNEVKDFLAEHFGDFDSEKLIEYNDLHKKIYVRKFDNNIEIYALKNDIQYFSKGWKLIR